MKIRQLWEVLDVLSFLILIISLGIILVGDFNCPDYIDTSTFYGLFISVACNFGFKGVFYIVTALISFLAIIILTSKIAKRRQLRKN